MAAISSSLPRLPQAPLRRPTRRASSMAAAAAKSQPGERFLFRLVDRVPRAPIGCSMATTTMSSPPAVSQFSLPSTTSRNLRFSPTTTLPNTVPERVQRCSSPRSQDRTNSTVRFSNTSATPPSMPAATSLPPRNSSISINLADPWAGRFRRTRHSSSLITKPRCSATASRSWG